MAPEGLNPTPEQMGIKPKETRFSDDKGNSMTIEEGAEGATVSRSHRNRSSLTKVELILKWLKICTRAWA